MGLPAAPEQHMAPTGLGPLPPGVTLCQMPTTPEAGKDDDTYCKSASTGAGCAILQSSIYTTFASSRFHAMYPAPHHSA
jgi:hypothetical protein